MGGVGRLKQCNSCAQIPAFLFSSQRTPSPQLSEQESNSSPCQGAQEQTQLLHTWEGRAGLRENMVSGPQHPQLYSPRLSAQLLQRSLQRQHSCI